MNIEHCIIVGIILIAVALIDGFFLERSSLEADKKFLSEELDEAIELAEETVGYASEYFQEKWRLNERLAELKANKRSK